MLPPDQSPIHQLVSVWWDNCRPPFRHELAAARIFLWTAALREIEANAAISSGYDPICDNRFLWATQWLDLAEGHRTTICPRITACAAVFLAPPLNLSRRDKAAGE